jgi:hypothetical protein
MNDRIMTWLNKFSLIIETPSLLPIKSKSRHIAELKNQQPPGKSKLTPAKPANISLST